MSLIRVSRNKIGYYAPMHEKSQNQRVTYRSHFDVGIAMI